MFWFSAFFCKPRGMKGLHQRPLKNSKAIKIVSIRQWKSPDWNLLSLCWQWCHLKDYHQPFSAGIRDSAVQKFLLVRKAALRQTLHIKRQQHILTLRVPAALFLKFEIGINILTYHLRDLSESQPCLISWHWASDVPLCNRHSFDIGLWTTPTGGGRSWGPVCSQAGRRTSELCHRSAKCAGGPRPNVVARNAVLSSLLKCSPPCIGFYFVPLCFGGYGFDPQEDLCFVITSHITIQFWEISNTVSNLVVFQELLKVFCKYLAVMRETVFSVCYNLGYFFFFLENLENQE